MGATCHTRRILLAVTGLSPQIVTETLYALAVGARDQQPPWLPTEVHVLTTERGADKVRQHLLAATSGWFHRLCSDYRLPSIRFDENSIHLLRALDGSVLDDIRNDHENRLAADQIADVVRTLSADPDCAIHASIAGGRKTMGFFLGYAMSLYGRPQDRLSHVLVSAPYESLSDFFYPTPYHHPVRSSHAATEPLDAALAQVWLGDIPFVRLRSEVDATTRERAGAAFADADAVRSVQQSLTPSRLLLKRSQRLLQIGHQRIELAPVDLAMLIWVLQRQQQQRPVQRYKAAYTEAQDDAQEYLAIYQSLLPDPDENNTRTHTRLLTEGMVHHFFDERLIPLESGLGFWLCLKHDKSWADVLTGR